MWKIEKIVSKGDYNYAVVREHPHATKHGYVLHHRVVVENALGRLLNPNEIVHHKNRRRKDNRRKNLEILDKHSHARLHGFERGRLWCKLMCPWCKTIFRRPKNATHLQKPSVLGCTCCSAQCRGKLSAQIQFQGRTRKVDRAISANILRIYRKYTLVSTGQHRGNH